MESLLDVSLLETARSLFTQSLAACSVGHAFRSRLVSRSNDAPFTFHLRGAESINLAAVTRLVILAVGKGGGTMVQALIDVLDLPPSCAIEGILVAPVQPANLPRSIRFFAGGHPLPTAASRDAAVAALTLLERVSSDDQAPGTFCFFLISGGASAMLELPLDPTISLADTRAFYEALLHCGASITEVNTVRKHFSAVKGGRLGAAAGMLQSLTLLVSDVPTAHLDALGSGPSLPDPSTVADCNGVLKRYHLLPQFPPPVRHFFEAEFLPETPKPATLHSRFYTLLSAEDLAEAARTQAESFGFTVIVDNTCDDWDFKAAADYLLSRLRRLREQHRRVCLLSVGEVTVQVASALGSTGDIIRRVGVGGRNQHFALYFATLLRASDRGIALLSAGSDGIDGNSPAAGAAVAYETLNPQVDPLASANAAPDLRYTAEAALLHFDAHTFLEQLGATITIGPTGNNLRDLRILLADSGP